MGQIMNKSDSIKELATALSKFQSETVDAIKDKKGDKGSYADLGQILNLVRPLMSKHGLSVAQLPCESAIEGNIAVDTMLMHKSGEWISNSFSMPINRIIRKADGRDVTNAPQASGSVITYARRYALTAVLGITQEDNDAAAHREEKQEQQRVASEPKISAEQVVILYPFVTQEGEDGAIEWSIQGEMIFQEYGINVIEELPASKFNELKKRLEESK